MALKKRFLLAAMICAFGCQDLKSYSQLYSISDIESPIYTYLSEEKENMLVPTKVIFPDDSHNDIFCIENQISFGKSSIIEPPSPVESAHSDAPPKMSRAYSLFSLLQNLFSAFKKMPAGLPLEVHTYQRSVVAEGYKYAEKGHEVDSSTFPGGYLEIYRKGKCDEFALNALQHLSVAPNLSNVGYVVLWEKQMLPFYPERGHAFVVYQNSDGSWRGISNGREIGLTSPTLERLVRESLLYFSFSSIHTSAYHLPVADIPFGAIFSTYKDDYRQELRDLEKGRKIF